MEQEKKKRKGGKEGGEGVIKDSIEKTAKRQHLISCQSNSNIIIINHNEESKNFDYKTNNKNINNSSSSSSSSSNSNHELSSSDENLELGVFDFPWLKEGMISKSEEWSSFEDSFSSFDGYYSTNSESEFWGQCLCEISPATCMAYSSNVDIDPVDNKFEENVWSLEMDTSSFTHQLFQRDHQGA